MRFKSILLAALVATFTFPAFAQAPAPAGTPTRVRGTVEKLDGKVLTVKSREGEDVAIALADDANIRAVARVRLSKIKAGDRVGVAALAGGDGKLHAQSITVFPDSFRVPEGQIPWDLTPGSTMTNATVAQVSKVSRGRDLQLQYKDGTADIDVPPRTPIVTYVPGTARLLRPGRAVVVFARKMPDGSMVAPAVAVQRGKVKPPM